MSALNQIEVVSLLVIQLYYNYHHFCSFSQILSPYTTSKLNCCDELSPKVFTLL